MEHIDVTARCHHTCAGGLAPPDGGTDIKAR